MRQSFTTVPGADDVNAMSPESGFAPSGCTRMAPPFRAVIVAEPSPF